jgi:HPt (histidine-containing phosphotransfer) domain-containing protein
MNWERLHHLFEGDEALIRKFTEVFKAEIPKQAEALVNAAAASRWDEVSNTAHAMKSQFAYAGLDLLTDLAMRVEKSAERNEELDKLPEMIGQLRQGIAELWQD